MLPCKNIKSFRDHKENLDTFHKESFIYVMKIMIKLTFFFTVLKYFSAEGSHLTMLIILVSVFLAVLLCGVSIARIKNNQKYTDRHQPCPKVSIYIKKYN